METLRKFKFLFLCVLALGLAGCETDSQKGGEEDVLVKKVTLDKEILALKEGAKPVQLTATVTPSNATNKKLSWESSDESVAVVNDGWVTAVSEGTATITAKAKDGSKKKATCEVIVTPLAFGEVLVDSISLTPSEINIELDEEPCVCYISAEVSPYDATKKELEWISTNEDVVTISSIEGSDGYYNVEFMSVGAGSAQIKAMAMDGSGVVAVCEVIVTTSNPEPQPDPEPDSYDVKKKLEAVGVEFVNAIKAETHQNLVEVIDYMDYAYGYYDIDEAYEDKLESLLVEEYEEQYARGKNPVKAMTNLAKSCVKAAQKGAQFSAQIAEFYSYTLVAGLPDLYGRFVPDSYNEEWWYDSSVTDRLEVAFSDNRGQNWVATLKGSKETTRVHITAKDTYISNRYFDYQYSDSKSYVDQYDIAIDVPMQMTFTVKCDTKTIIDMTVNSDLAFALDVEYESEYNDYYRYEEYWDEYWYEYDEYVNEEHRFEVDYKNLNVDAKMTVNGYEETFKTNVTKSGVTANASVKIDGKSMLAADAKVNADFNAFFDAVKSQNEPTPDEAANWLKDISVNIDVLGQVQLKASCPSFWDFYKASEQVNESYDFDSFSKAVESYNGAFDVKLYFDKKSSEVAFVEIEAREEYDEWDGYSYYYGSPVIVLTSDDSRHNIEDYFDDEASFTNLIDAVEKLAEDFENLYGDYL